MTKVGILRPEGIPADRSGSCLTDSPNDRCDYMWRAIGTARDSMNIKAPQDLGCYRGLRTSPWHAGARSATQYQVRTRKVRTRHSRQEEVIAKRDRQSPAPKRRSRQAQQSIGLGSIRDRVTGAPGRTLCRHRECRESESSMGQRATRVRRRERKEYWSGVAKRETPPATMTMITIPTHKETPLLVSAGTNGFQGLAASQRLAAAGGGRGAPEGAGARSAQPSRSGGSGAGLCVVNRRCRSCSPPA